MPGSTALTQEALAGIIDKLVQSREEQHAQRAQQAGRRAARPGATAGAAPFPYLSSSPGGSSAGQGGGSEDGGSSVGARNDSALWEEATSMLRAELIRLGREAAAKMEVGGSLGCCCGRLLSLAGGGSGGSLASCLEGNGSNVACCTRC